MRGPAGARARTESWTIRTRAGVWPNRGCWVASRGDVDMGAGRGSGHADDLELALKRLAIERLHHIFVGARLDRGPDIGHAVLGRSEEHTSELQSLMRISYAVFCLKKKKQTTQSNMS